MMSKDNLIHERNANVKIFEIRENKILVEGVLTDERFCHSFLYAIQEIIDPGIVHRMVVRMVLQLPKLVILSAEAEMQSVPVETCREAKDSVKKLVGLRLTQGFREKLNELLGGKNGCIHMNNLIIFMRTAAIQGLYSHYNRVRENGRLTHSDIDKSLIINSCHLWREEGQFALRFEEIRKVSQKFRSPKN